MMLIEFRSSAEADLRTLQSYLETSSPESLDPILADLASSLETISTFPSAGAQVRDRHYRRIVTPKYHFKIVYEVTAEQINILGILRQQGREV